MENSAVTSRQLQARLIEDALDAKRQKNLELSLQLYDQAIELGDRGFLAEAHYNKGVLALEREHREVALQCFQDALSVNPDYEKAWVNLGSVLLFYNRNKEALYAFEKAHALVPDQVISLFNKGYALNRLNRYAEALKIFSNLVSRNEKTKEVSQVLASRAHELYSETGLACLQLGMINDALHFFRMSFNLNSDDFLVCYNLAFLYDQLHQYDEALLFYDLSIALDPDQFKGYQGKACTLIHLKRYEDALDSISRSISLDPDNFEGYYNLACIYGGLLQKDNMIMAIEKALSLAPPNLGLKLILRKDPDFEQFSSDPEFVRITS